MPAVAAASAAAAGSATSGGGGGMPWTLHPFLSTVDTPTSRLWYVVSQTEAAGAGADVEGCNPGRRMGHGCAITALSNGRTVVTIVGGATPDGTLDDVHELSLGKCVCVCVCVCMFEDAFFVCVGNSCPLPRIFYWVSV